MSRLVVISNRLPLGDNPSGGLVVALNAALAGGGLWIGNSGETAETPVTELTEHTGAPFDRLSFDLTPQEHADYYLGFANSVLWPLCHGRTDLLDLRAEYLEAYRHVNRRVAKMIAEVVRSGDTIWVQDYHLIPMAWYLRQLGVMAPIGFFLHIPFPGPNEFNAMPNGDEVARWITAFDLFGLQTQRDVSACLEVFRTLDGGEILINGRVAVGGDDVRVASFPIGIEAKAFSEAAATAEPRGDPPPYLMIGVDRLDYSKGLPQRFRAFGQLLEQRPDLKGQVELLQIAPPTRDGVAAYDEVRNELEQLSGQINGANANLDWTPIRYMHRALPRESLAGLYRQAHVGLVTPLADGMNLVAKEYVAAQDPANPGVLVLSKFAGAVEQMGDALIVNPHDIDEMAQALVTALWMSVGERRERHQRLMAGILAQDVDWWRRTFLDQLAASPRAMALAG